MKGQMEGVTLVADWDPKPGFKLGAKDIERRQTYLGSQVWRNPKLEIREYDIPTPGPDEVLLEVKAVRHLRLGRPHGAGRARTGTFFIRD